MFTQLSFEEKGLAVGLLKKDSMRDPFGTGSV